MSPRKKGPHFAREARQIAHDLVALTGTPLITLSGPLGAGKTTLTKALLGQWGFESAKVQSPTFLHLFEYPTAQKGLVLHMDCYRMQDDFDWERLALESYADAAVWIVEWPEPFVRHLKSHAGLRRLLGFQRAIAVDISSERKVSFKVAVL